MGLITDAIRSVVPERKEAVGASVPTWESGTPQMNKDLGYEHSAKQGYMLDEVVFGCVEVRATSAAEPKICAYQGDKKVEKGEHAALQLLERPNPFLDGFTFWASVMMHLDVGGNAYVEKVRNRLGQVVELWLLRPDRVHVIPDSKKFIGGYRYTIGNFSDTLPPENVIQFKTRHPLNDYYGLSPMHVLANRIDLDVWARQFTQSFFKNAGVPAGLLNIKRAVTQQEREMIRQRWRTQFSGPEGWHNVLVMDGTEADYTPMGLPIGPRGTAVAELDEINEARICMAYQMPPSLLATRIGMMASSYANRKSDRELFWDSVLAPLYRYLAVTLSNGLQPDFPDLDRFEFDLSDVRALQEDEDKKHTRYREDWQAGLITRIEARTELGFPPEPEEPSVFLIPVRAIETPSDQPIDVAASGLDAGTPADQAALAAGAAVPGTGQQPPAAAPAPTGKVGA